MDIVVGRWYLFVRVDVLNEVVEIVEINNVVFCFIIILVF